MTRARFVLAAVLPVLWPACTIDFDRFSQDSSIATDASTPVADAGTGDEDASARQQDAAPDSGPAEDSGPAADSCPPIGSGQREDASSKPLDAWSELIELPQPALILSYSLAEWACIQVSQCEGKLGAEEVRARQQIYCHHFVFGRGPLVAKLKKALDAGEVKIDAEMADECLDAVVEDKTVYCDADFRGPPSSEGCARWLIGTLGEGQNCTLDAQCAPGLLCANESEHCPGTCQRGLQGEPCSATADCDHDYACVVGTCVARAGAGLPCASHDECASGLFCATGGKCEVQHVEGEDCQGGDSVPVDQASCESGLLCVDDEPGVKPPHCDPVGNLIGEPCSANLPCDYGTRCVDGMCRTALAPLPGYPVNTNNAPRFGGCDSHEQCAEGDYCSGGCSPRPLVGQSCSLLPPEFDPAQCYEGLCKFGTCRLGVEGDPCDPLQHGPLPVCEGYCADDGRCAAPLGTGASCDRDEQCGDGLVCAGPGPCKTCSALVCD